MTVSIITDTLTDVARFFEALPDVAAEAAYLAVNESARDALPNARKTMLQQVNFPKGYLNTERLGIRKKANKGNIEAVISGRGRPTSLARFAPGAARGREAYGKPIFVEVRPGHVVRMNSPASAVRAFLVNLKNGNTGLAVRLPKGEELKHSEKAVMLDNNLFLLYGPSVDQVFRGVANDITPDIIADVDRHFTRQFGRLAARG